MAQKSAKSEAKKEAKAVAKAAKKEISKKVKSVAEKKTFSQEEMDAAVKLAAEKSARTAVETIRAKDELRKEKKSIEKTNFKEALGKTVKKKDPAAEIKKAVKIAVLKDKVKGLDTDGVSTKSSTSNLDAAMEGFHSKPHLHGLNAAATAGISIARNILNKNNMPNGLTSKGFMDKETW